MSLQAALNRILHLLNALQGCAVVDALGPDARGGILKLLGPAYLAPGTKVAKVAGALMGLFQQELAALLHQADKMDVLDMEETRKAAQKAHDLILEAEFKRLGDAMTAREPRAIEEVPAEYDNAGPQPPK